MRPVALAPGGTRGDASGRLQWLTRMIEELCRASQLDTPADATRLNRTLFQPIGSYQPLGNYQPAGDYQPLNAELTHLSKVITQEFGRVLLSVRDATGLRDALQLSTFARALIELEDATELLAVLSFSPFVESILETTSASELVTLLALPETITMDFHNGGAVLATGTYGVRYVPFDCTINAVSLMADQVGSVEVNIYKDPFVSYPPTTSIVAAQKPTLSSAAAARGTGAGLSGWTLGVTAGDVLQFDIDTVATITRLTCTLEVTRD